MTSARFRQILLEEARAEGFPLAETLDLAPVLDPPTEPPAPGQGPRGATPAAFAPHLQRFDSWLAQGRHGEMTYLARGRDRRADPRRLLPGAKALLCVALPYPRRPAGATSLEQGPRYARYLQGPDYHADITARLTRAMERVRQRVLTESAPAASARPSVPAKGANPRIPAPRPGGPADPVMRWKICVDTSAILERSWAALAGLGWIGKNTLLIHPQQGSYLFLGEVLLDRETGRGGSPDPSGAWTLGLPDYCGHCTRCIQACPTQALVAPHELDSRKCISYATLEKRGDWPEETTVTAGYVAGCDICQEVCPFNRKPVSRELAALGANGAPGHDPTRLSGWESLLNETQEAYRARVTGTALERIRPGEFRRNLERARRESAPPVKAHPENPDRGAVGVRKAKGDLGT